MTTSPNVALRFMVALFVIALVAGAVAASPAEAGSCNIRFALSCF
ncbi:MAG: hypothetical protein AAF318_19830 [Pseudomonadota bacterium]